MITPMIGRKGLPPATKSVSYTHLDVYKRQVYAGIMSSSQYDCILNQQLMGGLL